MKPRGERTELATDIIAKLRPQLARVPGTLVFMQNPPTFGALVTLILFGMDLNIYAFVGMIMLIGIVEKNAIMQVDFALEAERSGMSSEQAIYQGCLIRFRPIMMTTMAALLGAVPIAIGFGAGGEARQPLGMAVVGGLVFSQLVTLYLTPVFFTYMAQLQQWLTTRRAAPQPRPANA